MTKSTSLRFSRIAGLLLSASLLGACAMPAETDDEFEAIDDMGMEDEGEEIAEAEQEIIGGAFATSPYQFPYVASLWAYGEVHVCGAAIIGSRWILTAAGCLRGWPLDALTVRAGDLDLSAVDGTEQTKTVASTYIHPDYNQFDENSVALLYLTEAFSLNAAVQTIPLPTGPAPLPGNPPANTFGKVLGWGRTSAMSGPSQILKHVNVPTQPDSTCDAALGQYLLPGELCAGWDSGMGFCIGDEGGPFILNGAVAGMAHWSSGNCDTYGVYTEVYHYVNWIKGVTGL